MADEAILYREHPSQDDSSETATLRSAKSGTTVAEEEPDVSEIAINRADSV